MPEGHAASRVITARSLTRDYGQRHALAGVSFAVAPGESVAILGPNGAGKSTLLQVLAGVLHATSGDALVAGLRIPDDAGRLGAKVGFVPQGESVYPELSVQENLRFFGRVHGVKGRALRERVDALLRELALGDRARQPAGTLSGGLRQRLAIGASLVHEPAVLLLDEPTTGLDPLARERLAGALKRYRGAQRAILFTTHSLDEASLLADRVLLMADGRLRATLPGGDPARLAAAFRQVGSPA